MKIRLDKLDPPQIGEIKKYRDIWGIRGTSLDRHKYIWAECELCGRARWVFLYKGRAQSPKCKSCSDKINADYGRRFIKTKPFKPTRIKERGYIKIRIPKDSPFISMATKDGYLWEHRLVMAEYLGRCLKGGEIVHHLNGIRGDNRRENLALTDSHNHPHRTLITQLQQRLRELEQLHLPLEDKGAH